MDRLPKISITDYLTYLFNLFNLRPPLVNGEEETENVW